MNTEEQLRNALQQEAKSITPADAWSHIEERIAEHRSSNRPRRTLLAAAAALLVVLGTIAVVRNNPDRSRVNAGNDPCTELSVPAEGASPQFLCDGTPVWVVRHLDGSLSVLGAIGTHYAGLGRLSEWCDSSRGFADAFSRYDEFGLYLGGPAPEGLPVYAFSTDDDRVTVTRDLGRRGREDSSTTQPSGPNCGDTTTPLGSVFHDASIFPQAAEDSPRNGDMYLVRGDLVVDHTGARVCMPSAGRCTFQFEAPDVDEFERSLRGKESPYTVDGPFVGRLGPNGLTDIYDVREPPSS